MIPYKYWQQKLVSGMMFFMLTELPKDLYIPPEALQVFLETFEGPLDLLLYLIKKNNIDILDIPIAEITRQYLQYIDAMCAMQMELTAEYLVMAAQLAEIKSRLLLPKPIEETTEEGDPRAELVRRLQEYERFKKAAYQLDELPRLERDIFIAAAEAPPLQLSTLVPVVRLDELFQALRTVWERARQYQAHRIVSEPLSIRERMSLILSKLDGDNFVGFSHFFTAKEGRLGVAVTFIAILELIRQSSIELAQSMPFAPIYVRPKAVHLGVDACLY